MVFLKLTGNTSTGAIGKIGGKIWDWLDKYHNDTDITAGLDPSAGGMAKINTPTAFRDDRLKLYDSTGNFLYTISTSALAANRQITVPILTANDTVAFLGTIKGVPASYFVYKVSTTYYAYNGVSNTLDYSNSDFKTLMTSVVSALTSGGKIILGPGDFTLSTVLTITQDNITIEGFGVDITRILLSTGTTSAAALQIGTGTVGTNYTLTANSLKNTRTLTVATTAGLAAGDWITLQTLVTVDANSATRYYAEFHKIESVDSGTVITVEDMLTTDFTTANSSVYNKVPWTKGFTLKDLTLYDTRAADSVATADDGPFYLAFCYGPKIMNVKCENMSHDSIHIESCFNITLTDIYIETPHAVLDAAGLRYGVYLTGASTNFNWTGGWGNRCRHTFTNNTNSGGAVRRGKQRNITITGVNSYNADTAHFDTHQAALGVTFNGCTTIANQHGDATTDAQGFNMRSPATLNGCVVVGATGQAMVLWIDSDVAGDDFKPGGSRTTVNACQIISPNQADADTNRRGIVVNGNRGSIIISNCQFYDINRECIKLNSPTSNIIITGNMFHSCGGSLGSTNGMINITGTVNDLTITSNIFGAGTPPPLGRPFVIATAGNRIIFKNNNVNGLTNKSPTIPAISTDITMLDNIGLNPIGKITNPVNTTQNTIGNYGGTTSTVVASTDYTVVGGTILITSTGGTGVSITTKDNLGNTITSGDTSLTPRTLARGFKVNWGAFSVAPTVGIFAW